jgi:hypothetical protein
MKAARNRLELFFFPAISDTWLSVMRAGLGVQIVLYSSSLYGEWHSLFAFEGGGWVNRDLTEAILTANASLIPRIGWLVAVGNRLGLSEGIVLTITWISLLSAGCFLIAGLYCRTAAILAWFLYVCAAKSGNLVLYGVDNFTIVGLFYLMIAPFPDHYALDWKLRGLPGKDPQLHGFFRRVLQLHLCVIYFSGGVSKCLGSEWWNGESMWRALTRPPFNVIPISILVSGHALLMVVGITVIVLETGYPFFIWLRRTRLIWLTSILCMHVMIGVTMGLYLFGLIMIVLNLAAFGGGVFWREKTPAQFAAADLAHSSPLPSTPLP